MEDQEWKVGEGCWRRCSNHVKDKLSGGGGRESDGTKIPLDGTPEAHGEEDGPEPFFLTSPDPQPPAKPWVKGHFLSTPPLGRTKIRALLLRQRAGVGEAGPAA